MDIEKKFDELRIMLEDGNEYGEVLILECLKDQRYDLVIRATELQQKHITAGHLTEELNNERKSIYKELGK